MAENQNKFENQLKSKVTSNSLYWIIMINYWHIWVLWIQGCSGNFKASGNLLPCCRGKTLLRWPEISQKIVNWIWLWWRKEVEKRQSISQLWFRCMFSGILTQGGFIFWIYYLGTFRENWKVLEELYRKEFELDSLTLSHQFLADEYGMVPSKFKRSRFKDIN